MDDAYSGGVALLAGAALGAAFFGGLWWTVQRCAVSEAPAGWFLGSFVVRTTLVLAGFYVVGAGHPARMGLCLAGFLLARFVLVGIHRARPAAAVPSAAGKPPCA